MPRTRLALPLLLVAFAGLMPARGGAVDAAGMDKAVRIGSLGDQSSIAADVSGVGSVTAARMAIEDSGLLQEGWTIDVIAADHQNKPTSQPASPADGSMSTRSMRSWTSAILR